MFFARRRRHCPVAGLLLALLGVKAVRRHCASPEDRAEFKAKSQAFRSKLHEAFDVLKESKEQPSAATEENQ
ncbi:MAG: hypothetical protein ACM3XM_03285 [Mycobacterium leprae]